MGAFPVFPDIKNTLLHWQPQLGEMANQITTNEEGVASNLSLINSITPTTPAQWTPTYGVASTSGTISYNTTVSNTLMYSTIANKIGIVAGRLRFTLTGAAGGTAGYVTLTLPFSVNSALTTALSTRGLGFSAISSWNPTAFFVGADQVTLNIGFSPETGTLWQYNETNGQVFVQHAFILA